MRRNRRLPRFVFWFPAAYIDNWNCCVVTSTWRDTPVGASPLFSLGRFWNREIGRKLLVSWHLRLTRFAKLRSAWLLPAGSRLEKESCARGARLACCTL